MRPVTFACVLFQGGSDNPNHSRGIFTPEWADRLYRGIKRNLKTDFRFVCFVDREYEFKEPVEQKLLELPYRNMLSLLEPFREDMGRVIFMGLDTIITGDLEPLVPYDGPFAMLRDPYLPDTSCSGVMSFPYTPEIWNSVLKAHESGSIKDHRLFGYISDMMFLNTVPHVHLDDHVDGIYSYKAHIKEDAELLKKARIVYFHGKEKPHELAGSEWVEKHWGEPLLPVVSFTSQLNNDSVEILKQANRSAYRGLPIFEPSKPHDREIAIVGGGPSLNQEAGKIRAKYLTGVDICSLNGTHDWLFSRGINPRYHVMLDSRKENEVFVKHPRPEVEYFISGLCHQSIFDRLQGYKVTTWFSDMPGISSILPHGIYLVGGGATVGLKALYLWYAAGYRKFHLFGFDSSYLNGENHAYKQPMNDLEARIDVTAGGRAFHCARWMAKQAIEFQEQARMMVEDGCDIQIYGDGLLPHMASMIQTKELKEIH